MSVTFGFSFDSREGAEAARTRLIAKGCEIDVQPQEGNSVVLAVVTPRAESAPELTQAWLCSIAEPFGGECLGCGALASYGLG